MEEQTSDKWDADKENNESKVSFLLTLSINSSNMVHTILSVHMYNMSTVNLWVLRLSADVRCRQRVKTSDGIDDTSFVIQQLLLWSVSIWSNRFFPSKAWALFWPWQVLHPLLSYLEIIELICIFNRQLFTIVQFLFSVSMVI